MANSINTNVAAYFAQANITLAAEAASKSVARLSSGNRIVQASDDVAALATGASLTTQVSAARSALVNVSQGTSLLQVADGALTQIQNILQQQKSIALQAGSGSLTNTDRGFLNQQFQALLTQIDSLTQSTTFNGVVLLDGSLSQSAAVNDTQTLADAGSAQLTFNNDIASGETVLINGQTLTAGTDFTLGSSLAETVNNLAAALNDLASNATAAFTVGVAKYAANGNTLVITARSGGSLSNNFYVNTTGTATRAGEATLSGGFGIDSSFNLFTTSAAQNITSATQVLTATTAASTTPFQAGDTITATINGTSKTLYTIAASATATDIVNGINANKGTTGVSAALVYDSSTSSYNIRLDYDGLASNVIVNLGTNFNGTTYDINGQGLDSSGSNLVESSGATKNEALIYTKYVDTLSTTTGITAAAVTTTVTTATPGSSTATPFAIGDNVTVTINGTTKVLHTFATNDGLDDIVSSINSKTADTGVVAAITGSGGGYGLRLYVTDPYGAYSSISVGPDLSTGVTANTTAATTGATLTQATTGSLTGGVDNGLNLSSTAVTGTVGDSVLTTLSQARASVSLLLTENPSDGDSVTIGGISFVFTTNSTNKAPNEITIGDSLQGSLDNTVNTINSYLSDGFALDSAAYILNQLDITRSGNSLVFTGKGLSNPTTLTGGTVTITQSVTGASITNSGALTNASSTYGINVTGVTNADFIGSIQGFTATYKDSADTVDLSIKIGDYTYTAKNVDATVTSDTAIRLYSDTLADGTSGGYFDLQLKGNEISTFSNQAGANVVADRLNAAFSSLSFLQKHNVSSYSGTQSISANSTVIGSLIGSSVSAQFSSFGSVKLSDISVTAPSGSNTDAKITITVNGGDYSTSNNLGSTLGANQTYRLVSAADPNQFIEFRTGDTTIDISSSDNANAVEDALREAFGANSGSAALSFQIGAQATDTLSVSIGSAKTSSLYGGLTLDVATQSTAAIASSALNIALNAVTALRAGVGALQTQFNFAAAAIQVSLQNQDAARGQLLDTDVAVESTAFATAQVKLQAGISVLAQANQQLQSLLKLIG